MIKYENQCIGCTSMGLPCMGSTCPNLNVPIYSCNKCDEEIDEIYEVDGEELCEECLKDMFRVRK